MPVPAVAQAGVRPRAGRGASVTLETPELPGADLRRTAESWSTFPRETPAEGVNAFETAVVRY